MKLFIFHKGHQGSLGLPNCTASINKVFTNLYLLTPFFNSTETKSLRSEVMSPYFMTVSVFHHLN